MNTVSITVSASPGIHDILIAYLTDLPIEGIEQKDNGLSLFILEKDWNTGQQARLTDILSHLAVDTGWSESVLEPRNWNREWQLSLKPMSVGPFRITTGLLDDTDPCPKAINLIIEPRMSFGTGYHESTRLALRQLASIDVRGSRVLDAGTGTGILAIAAVKLGASNVTAFDVDSWAYRNSIESTNRNGVGARVAVLFGGIDSVPETVYELILANINKTVLLELIPRFSGLMTTAGSLVLSGLLFSDRAMIGSALRSEGLSVVSEKTEGDWWSPVASLQSVSGQTS